MSLIYAPSRMNAPKRGVSKLFDSEAALTISLNDDHSHFRLQLWADLSASLYRDSMTLCLRTRVAI